jgi:hypothetical protein
MGVSISVALVKFVTFLFCFSSLKEEVRLLFAAALSYGGCNTLDKLKHL